MYMEHSENCKGFCEGKVSCPETGKEECGFVVNWNVYKDGTEEPATICCFGCNKPHDVTYTDINSVTWYCPLCGYAITSPHKAKNPKGFYFESICENCGTRIIGGSLKGWITDKAMAEGIKVEYRRIYTGDKSKPPLYVIED